MDDNRFDELAIAIAAAETSRRSILQRVIGGGLVATLLGLGAGVVSPDDADAKNKCKKKCKKKNTSSKRKKCRKKCNKASAQCATNGDCSGSSLCISGSCTVPAVCAEDADCEDGELCINEICLTPPEIDICTDDPDCDAGLVCVAGACTVVCSSDEDCSDGLLCIEGACVFGNECESNGDCGGLVPVCLIGACVAAVS